MVSAGESAVERVTLTTDDATLPAVEDIAAILHAQGFAVERRAFVRVAAEEPRRVILLSLERPLPALVALVALPTAPPGLDAALTAALYPDEGDDAAVTLQLKGEGVFVSMTANSEPDMRDALRALANRARSMAWRGRTPDGGERRIAYVGRRWYIE